MNERDAIAVALLLAAGIVALPIALGLLVTPWSWSTGHWTIGLLALAGLIGVGIFLRVTLGQGTETIPAVSTTSARYARGETAHDEYETTKTPLRE